MPGGKARTWAERARGPGERGGGREGLRGAEWSHKARGPQAHFPPSRHSGRQRGEGRRNHPAETRAWERSAVGGEWEAQEGRAGQRRANSGKDRNCTPAQSRRGTCRAPHPREGGLRPSSLLPGPQWSSSHTEGQIGGAGSRDQRQRMGSKASGPRMTS